MNEDTQPLEFGDEFSRQEKRRQQFRESKRRSRREKGRRVSITVELTPEAYVALCALGDRSRMGGGARFWKTALIQGALFTHNIGQGAGHRAKLAEFPALQKELGKDQQS